MGQPRIIIVEDEMLVARDLAMQLAGWGYEVVAITDRGEEAVRIVGELRPDLVLMDIRLRSEMDGITAAQQILDRFQLPVLFLTAFSDEHTVVRANKTRPAGLLFKPIEVDALLTAIERALEPK